MPIVNVFGKCPEETAGTLSWSSPAVPAIGFGTTTGTITWSPATGGLPPYTYSATVLSYDSSDVYDVGISDASLVTTLTGLTDGTAYIFQRSVTDATGEVVVIQAAVVVAPGLSTITVGAPPASHFVVPADDPGIELGYWGEASGGVAPYTYTLTELTGYGTTIYQSGLFFAVSGLTNGISLMYMLTVEDSVGARGYSAITVTVESIPSTWIVLADLDFTDDDWTALSSTDATSSTSVRQHRLYGADGITPKADIWNRTTSVRELSISPGGTGLIMKTTSTAANPSIKLIPLDSDGSNLLRYGFNWTTDVAKIEFIAESEENAGSGAFAKIIGLAKYGTNSAGFPQHGYRIYQTGSNTASNRRGFTSTIAETAAEATLTTSPTRKICVQWEGYITGGRTIESYGRSAESITDYSSIPRSGIYWMHQSASQTMSKTPTLIDFLSWGTEGGWGLLLYNDGVVVDDGVTNFSRLTLKKLRISRLANGAKP